MRHILAKWSEGRSIPFELGISGLCRTDGQASSFVGFGSVNGFPVCYVGGLGK